MSHCPGVINNSDDMTEALGWVLHSRHCRRSVGHHRSGSLSSARPLMPEQRPSEPGRVLEPNPRPTGTDGLGRGVSSDEHGHLQ